MSASATVSHPRIGETAVELEREGAGRVASREPEASGSRSGPDADPSPAETGVAGAPGSWRHPSANALVVSMLLLIGVRIGLTPLHDNSFLTHLATGRLILDHGSVPGHDPYSWTAHGSPWTVQSWGASVVYAGLERSIGLVGIRLFDMGCTVALVLLLWRLTRPAGRGLLARAVPAGLVACMGTSLWVERPLLFGAVGLALVYLAADDGLDPRWLVPVMWIWVNTHGSFPFGIGLLALLTGGRWLDERTPPRIELRALRWAALGTALGALNPIGPKLLLFPVELFNKREAFKGIAEWEPTRFHRGVELFFAFQLVLALVLILARHRRWRAILPTVVFGAAAVASTRNILQASIVLTPILALGMAGLGTIDGERRPRLLRPVTGALAVLTVLIAGTGIAQGNTALGNYPEKATRYMRTAGLLGVDDRVVARDWVGNYLEYRYGPDQVRVFIDDRVDMYPLRVIRDFTTLLDWNGRYQTVLDKYRPTSVLWKRDSDFGRWIARSDRWRIAYRDTTWLVAIPRR